MPVGLILLCGVIALIAAVASGGSSPSRHVRTTAALRAERRQVGPPGRSRSSAPPHHRATAPDQHRATAPPHHRATASARAHIASPAVRLHSRDAATPLATVDAYWRSIDRHDFAAAYAQLLPGTLPMGRGGFVATEEQTGIEHIAFVGHTVSVQGDQATVAVDSLVTQDQRYGCAAWSGSYALVRSAGVWRIAHAALASRPCA